MRFPLPSVPTPALRRALTTTDGLRTWWDPDAEAGNHVTPGLDAPAMHLAAIGDSVTWSGELLRARFDLVAGTMTLEGTDALDDYDRVELALAWEIALATLGWALAGSNARVTWKRAELPLALAYTDAWGRIDGAEGLAGEGAVRIAGERLQARRLLVRPPRVVLLDIEGALLRVAFGPGESVNAARIDLLSRGHSLPAGWETWLAKRLGMTWVAQLGEEGG